MYCLRAVVAAEPVLRQLPGPLAGARIVALDQGLSMVPLTGDLAEVELGDSLATCSLHGPIASVEAEIFGGVGTQSAEVWEAGELVLGPLHLDEHEPFPPEGSPISRALRRLGVDAGPQRDEFDAVGLGRHRSTEEWLG